jgi:hypothetical protein
VTLAHRRDNRRPAAGRERQRRFGWCPWASNVDKVTLAERTATTTSGAARIDLHHGEPIERSN